MREREGRGEEDVDEKRGGEKGREREKEREYRVIDRIKEISWPKQLEEYTIYKKDTVTYNNYTIKTKIRLYLIRKIDNVVLVNHTHKI